MKKDISKKFLGLGLGMLMLGGVIGAVSASGNTAKADTGAVQTRDFEVYSDDLDLNDVSSEFFSEAQINSNYAKAREVFEKLSFEEQKKGLTGILQESIDEYNNGPTFRGFMGQGYLTDCETKMERVKQAKTSEDLIKLVDEEDTLLNFLM